MPRRPMLGCLAARCRLPAGLGLALLLSAVLGSGLADARNAETANRPPAAEPGSVRFTHSYGWWPVDTRRLVLWAGVEEPYLVDLAPGCSDLRNAALSGLTTHNRRLSPRIDSVVMDGRPCPIERIQPATGSTLKSLGIRREDARPLPIQPLPIQPVSTQPAQPPGPSRKTP